MKRLSIFASAAVLAFSFALTGCADKAENTSESAEQAEQAAPGAMELPVDIGIIQLADLPAFDASREGFVAALAEAGYKEGENIEIEFQNAQNYPDNLKVISQKFVNDGKDIVLAVSTPAAQAMADETKDIPIIFAAVTDPVKSQLVAANEAPGANVSGVSDLTPVKAQIELLKKLLPDAHKISILYCSGEDNSRIQAETAKGAAEALGLTAELKTASTENDIKAVAQSVVGACDAVYIPTDNLFSSNMSVVSEVLDPANIPVIVGEKGMVEGGGLASVTIDYNELGRRAGSMAAQIIEGADISSMPVQYPDDTNVVINEDAAAELGITIPEDISSSAEMVTSASFADQAQ